MSIGRGAGALDERCLNDQLAMRQLLIEFAKFCPRLGFVADTEAKKATKARKARSCMYPEGNEAWPVPHAAGVDGFVVQQTDVALQDRVEQVLLGRTQQEGY